MTHTAEHAAQEGGALPDDPMSMLLGMLPPEALAVIGGFGGGAEQGPSVYMGDTVTPVTRVRVGNVDRNTQRGSVRRGGETVSDVRTVDDAVAEFYVWDDKELADFQERAFNAGLYGTRDRSQVRFGDPTDAKTYNIWADMVEASAGFYRDGAGRKVTPWDAVDLAGRGQTGIPEDEPEKPGANVVANPDDLRATFRAVTQEALGQALSDEQIDKMVRSYQARQTATNTAGDAANDTGATVEQMPSAATFADVEAKKADPVAYDSYKVLDKFSQVLETFGGSNARA